MTKSLNYFFPDKAEGKAEGFDIIASNRFKDENGEPIAWKFRLLSAKEINQIQNGAVKTSNSGGRIQTTTDMDFLKTRAILDSLEYPNLKDKELQDAYGVMSDRELLDALLEGREIERLGSKVLTYQGFVDDFNGMIDDAKN